MSMMSNDIPNPLDDAGVAKDIKDKVEEIERTPIRLGGLYNAIQQALTRAATWGYLEGFRLGWRIHEMRTKQQS